MVGKTRLSIALGLLLVFFATAQAQLPGYAELPQDLIEERLKRFAGPDPVRADTMKKLFAEAGCTGERLRKQAVERADAPNVICTLPGDSDRVIIVGAHFDYVPKGEGVADNWSGASLLPSLYQSLNITPRRHTFVFIGFTDEEEGFFGSQAYADQLTRDEVARIQAMINLDTLGLGPTQVWVSDSDQELVGVMAEVADEMRLPVSGMNIDGFGDSDGKPFKNRNIPIITIHSVTPENIKILHTHKDRLSAIKLGDYYHSYRLIARYLVMLDSKQVNSPSPPAN